MNGRCIYLSVVGGWLRPQSRGAEVCAIFSSLLTYLHDVFVRLSRWDDDIELYIDYKHTKQDGVCTVPVIPQRLIPKRLGMKLRRCENELDTGHARAATAAEP